MQLIKQIQTKAKWPVRLYPDGRSVPCLGYANIRYSNSGGYDYWKEGVNGIWKADFAMTGVSRGRSSVSFLMLDVSERSNGPIDRDDTMLHSHVTASGALLMMSTVGRLLTVTNEEVCLRYIDYTDIERPVVGVKQEMTIYSGFWTVVKQGSEYSLRQ